MSPVTQVVCGGVVATPPATSASRIAQMYQGDFELVLVANALFKRGQLDEEQAVKVPLAVVADERHRRILEMS